MKIARKIPTGAVCEYKTKRSLINDGDGVRSSRGDEYRDERWWHDDLNHVSHGELNVRHGGLNRVSRGDLNHVRHGAE